MVEGRCVENEIIIHFYSGEFIIHHFYEFPHIGVVLEIVVSVGIAHEFEV